MTSTTGEQDTAARCGSTASARDVARRQLRKAFRSQATDNVDAGEAFGARCRVHTQVTEGIAAVTDVLQPPYGHRSPGCSRRSRSPSRTSSHSSAVGHHPEATPSP